MPCFFLSRVGNKADGNNDVSTRIVLRQYEYILSYFVKGLPVGLKNRGRY